MTESQSDINGKKIKQIVEDYHSTHTYIGKDVYVCSDMASDVWNMVKTQNINAVIVVGNVDRGINTIEEANHAWVRAEIAPGNWIAMETTGGFLVCNDPKICSVNNQFYFSGWEFQDPKALKDVLEKMKHPCPDGYIFGEDQLCHPSCGGNTYCEGDSVCVNGECKSCQEGYIMGDDLKCHQPCGSTQTYCKEGGFCINGECRKCQEGYIMGDDMLCHQPCGSTKSYCSGNSICINGMCRSCQNGYILGADLQCHQPCGSTTTYCPGNSICVNGKCL